MRDAAENISENSRGNHRSRRGADDFSRDENDEVPRATDDDSCRRDGNSRDGNDGNSRDRDGKNDGAGTKFFRFARVLYLLVLAALVAVAALNFPSVNADLAGLLGAPKSEFESALVALSRASANRVRVLVEAENFDAAKAGAIAFEAEIPDGLFRAGASRIDAAELREMLDFYAAHASGLLSERSREALQRDDFSGVSARALALWLAPAGSPVPAPRDPYGLLVGFLSELPSAQSGFSLRDGFLCAEADGKTFILLEYAVADGISPEVFAERFAFAEKFEKNCAESSASDGVPAAAKFCVHLSGAPLHTAAATQNSLREMNTLLVLAFATLFALLFVLFRSLRVLVPAALSIGAGFLGGLAATALAFPQIHVLVFVFGTSLVGLGADYAFHFYLRRGANISRAMFTAFLTTILCFSVLLFSSFAVLRQLAVFSIVGLAFVLFFVLLFGEKIAGTPHLPRAVSTAENFARALTQRCRGFLRKGGLPALVFIALVGVSFATFSDDARALYSPPRELAERERAFAQICAKVASEAQNSAETVSENGGNGVPENASGNGGNGASENGGKGAAMDGLAFCVVPGASLEEILQKEESAGFSGMRLSAFLPSKKRQTENAELAAKLYANANLAETLGLENAFVFEKKSLLSAENAPALLRRIIEAFYFPGDVFGENDRAAGTVSVASLGRTGGFSLVPVPADFCAPEGTFVLTPSGAISSLLESYRAQTIHLLCAAFGVLFCALAVIYRRKMLRFLVAPALTVASVVAVLSFCAIPLSFVHFLAFFMLVGFGLDYCVFRDDGDGERELPVLLSCFTSTMSFGLLAFTRFSLTNSLGSALGLGLVFAYFYSSLLSKKKLAPAAGAAGTTARGSVENFVEKSGGETRGVRRSRGGVSGGEAWFEQKEQSAGTLRLELLWLVYRFFPLSIFNAVLFCVSAVIFVFAKPMRRSSRAFLRVLNAAQEKRSLPRSKFSSFAHMRAFVDALFDKFDISARHRRRLSLKIADEREFAKFRAAVAAGTGAFLLCSHVGNIEFLRMFPRLRADALPRKMHAFREFSQTQIFLSFLQRHCRDDAQSTEILPTETIDLATADAMKSAVERGELVMMAADRVSAGAPERNFSVRLLDREVAFPRGVFLFARLMECPAFFVACVKTAPAEYTFFCEEAPRATRGNDAARAAAFARFLEPLILRFPTQFFHFYDYFGEEK